jgi:hypothetical protein
MPCGGIYPIKGTWVEKMYDPNNKMHSCFHCHQWKPPDLFCDEWDCFLHSECVEGFLKTEEGEVVLDHRHSVTIMKGGKYVVLYAEQ